jgi:hypothetical protein
MNAKTVSLIKTEYRDLISVGASHDEAIRQVGIILELHPEFVEAFLTY